MSTMPHDLLSMTQVMATSKDQKGLNRPATAVWIPNVNDAPRSALTDTSYGHILGSKGIKSPCDGKAGCMEHLNILFVCTQQMFRKKRQDHRKSLGQIGPIKSPRIYSVFYLPFGERLLMAQDADRRISHLRLCRGAILSNQAVEI